MTYETKRLYRPLPPPQSGDPQQIALWMYRELQRVSETLEQTNVFSKAYVEPDKPQDGQVEYADGTQWDPESGGLGAGLYLYLAGTWTKL